MEVPIEYAAVVRSADGVETQFELDFPGWLNKPEVARARTFTLVPKGGADLPVISVHLDPLPDGTERRLVYLSRVFGRVTTTKEEIASAAMNPLFRLYCLGWEATIAERKVQSVVWVYPGGSVVVADYPPYTEELLDYYAAQEILAN